MMMKILLTVAPFWNEPETTSPRHIRSCAPLAPYLLCAILKKEGHEVVVFDPSVIESELESRKFVARFTGFDLVGISATSGAWPNARKVLEPFVAMPKRPILVLGGPHPSAFPEHVLLTTPADAVVVGEGDRSFPQLVRALEKEKPLKEVSGIAWKNKDNIMVNPPGERLSSDELAALPDPDFTDLPSGYYDVIPVETSRGCHHQCVFCSNKFGRGIEEVGDEEAARRIKAAGKWMSRSDKNILFTVDDCFTAGAERVKAVASVARENNFGMVIEARVHDILRQEVFDEIIRMNPVKIEIGGECGYKEGLKRIGKGTNIKALTECAYIIKEAGLAERVRLSFVMGLPWETRKEVGHTMKYAVKIGAKTGLHIQLNWFSCYPRSPIHRNADRWGINITPSDYDRPFWWKNADLFNRTHPKLTTEDALKSMKYLNQLIKRYSKVVFEGAIGI